MPFLFSIRDQQFYAEKGFENEPQRCRDCRNARKSQRAATAGTREMFEAVCAQCGVSTTVPFKPRGDRPVYCRACFSSSMAPVRA
jgi:CxxC-x17-CxxC domain-containing protein